MRPGEGNENEGERAREGKGETQEIVESQRQTDRRETDKERIL